MELVLFEAHRAKGWQWVEEEPLWTSWSLHKFGMGVDIGVLLLYLLTFVPQSRQYLESSALIIGPIACTRK